MSGHRSFVLLLLCALRIDVAGAAEPVKPAPQITILGAGSYWRQYVTRTPPRVSVSAARAAGLKLDAASRAITRAARPGIIHAPSDPPPPRWRSPDFDDAGWIRAPKIQAGHHSSAMSCSRGKFRVNDPAAVKKLTLEVAFTGGIAVYLNGRQVLRGALPKGPLTPETAADDYPDGAFFVKSGPRKGKLLHHYYDRALKAQFALRSRKAGPVELPVSRLRKGVNVLAIELHRSGYPAQCRKVGAGQFAPIGLARLFLRAVAAKGAVTPAVARLPGFQVWNADVTDEVTELDWGSSCEPLRPVRILAVRGGTRSGQVVAGSTREIVGLRARRTALTHTDGRSTVPAGAVSIRYGRLGGQMRYHGGSVYGGPTGAGLGVYFRRFDGLVTAAPPKVAVTQPGQKLRTATRRALGLPDRPVAGAVAPIWITVEVPRDAPAGRYRGILTIGAKGEKDVTVPVELEVFGWTLPDVKDYVSEFSVYQSPDTLAAYYKVPLWSEKHWALIEKSVQLIGGAGNHTIILPLLSKEQAGNEESYVCWIKQPDGAFKYDTTVMDRYVDLYVKHHDRERIKAVCLTVWGNAGVASGNPYQKHKYDERGLPAKTRGTFTVTVLDPKTGKKSDMALPPLGTKEYADFWRPVLLRVKANLATRRLADRIAVGMPADPPVPWGCRETS